jgi:hypothetical protein
MERKKFGAGLIALVAGIALSAGSAFAQSGYLQGDPAYGKLIPYYTVDANTATIIGLEHVGAIDSDTDVGVPASGFILVSVAIFDVYGADKYGGIFLCLSAYEFGYVILQDATASGAQVAETLRDDVIIASVEGGLSSSGYVTLAVTGAGSSCQGMIGPNTLMDSEHRIAAWTVVQDIGTGFYATEIPTTTANVDADGAIDCAVDEVPVGATCAGLIPMGNTVVARYDTNPYVGSMTSIFVWLNSDAVLPMRDSVKASMQCENGMEIRVTIPMPDKVNVLNPATFTAIEQCPPGQYRGLLRFDMPDDGFLFSHISQVNASYRMNFLGYNLDQNHFIGQ